MSSVFVVRKGCVYSLPFSDNFARTDGAVGNCWIGNGSIASGVAVGGQIKRGVGQTSVDATMDYNSNGSITYNFLFRLQQNNQTLSDYYYVSVKPGSSELTLVQHTGGGGDTVLALATLAGSTGTIRVIATDVAINIYGNGVMLIFYPYTPTAGANGTWVAMQTGDTTPVKTDNVVLTGNSNSSLDTFNRADGALGSPWTTQLNSGFTIVSNQAKPNGAAGVEQQSVRTVDAAAADMQVECTVPTFPTSNAAGVVARWVDSNNFYLCDVISGGSVRLFKKVGGAYTNLLPGTAGTISSGGRIAIRCQGTTIKVLINNSVVQTVTDSSLTSGKSGLRGDDPNARLDNHQVTVL